MSVYDLENKSVQLCKLYYTIELKIKEYCPYAMFVL